jgi:phage baseplate assembly protein W
MTYQRAKYRGFSTAKQLETRGVTFSTADIETVKRDLLNHIFTIPGERVMNPTFGTRIPLMQFEPLDEKSIKIIEDDLKAVVSYDPRVRLIEVAVLAMPDNNAIVAYLDLEYLQLGVTETMKLSFQTGS